MLDLYLSLIVGKDEAAEKQRKKAIKVIKKEQYRQYTFNYLTASVRKGIKSSLKRIQKKDEKGNVIGEYYQRDDIEREILQYNTHHFTKVYQSKAYKDKIYKKLPINEVRNKILTGRIRRQDFDDENVYEFFILLKNTNNNNGPNYQYNLITEEE